MVDISFLEAATAFVGLVALFIAHDAVKEAKKARRVTLLLDLSQQYSTAEMHRALTYLGRMRAAHGGAAAMAAAYVAEVNARPGHAPVEWDEHRRRVSKFFARARVLCVAELLDEDLLAQTLQRAAFDMCVDVIGPLDRAQNNEVLKRSDFDERLITFFDAFRKRHFSEVPTPPAEPTHP